MYLHSTLFAVPRLFSGALLALFALSTSAQDRYTGPIIDMHLHARSEVQADHRFCFPQPCEGEPTLSKNVTEMRATLSKVMSEQDIVLGVISAGNPNVVLDWVSADEERLIAGITRPSRFSAGELEEYFVKGRFRVLGEMNEQYWGVPADDPSLDYLYLFAVEHDIPVHIHLGGLGGSPTFPANLGNPLRLTPVLQKYPQLRIYIENASWPFLEEITALMYVYPNVYVDISTILHLTPRAQALRYLKGLVDNGLGKRVMYGSDQMSWPEVIPIVIEAIQTADFLSEQQKADIFYNNAARFLRLSDDEIARHKVLISE